MNYSNSKTYTKIIRILYILLAFLAICVINKYKNQLDTPIIDSETSNEVIDATNSSTTPNYIEIDLNN